MFVVYGCLFCINVLFIATDTCCDRYLLRLSVRMYVVLVVTEVALQPMSCINVCPVCLLCSSRPLLVATDICCDRLWYMNTVIAVTVVLNVCMFYVCMLCAWRPILVATDICCDRYCYV